MSQYYIGKDNKRLGPYPLEQLISYGVTPDTLVWCTGMPGWQKAIDVPEVAVLFVPKQPDPLPQPQPQEPQYQQPQYQQPQYQQPQYQQPQYQQPQYQQPQYQQPQYQQPQYQQPQFGYGQPQFGYQSMPPRPDNNMVWAVLSTVLCCLPLGIVAIIKAAQVNDLYNRGDYDGAVNAASSAKTWAMWGAGISLLGGFIYFILVMVGIANAY